MFIAALFTIDNLWKQPKCPSVDAWIKQLWDIFMMEYYLIIKKKKILPFATVWMDLENIMLSEVSQTEKDKYMISLICGIEWTNWTNRQNRQTQVESRLTAAGGGEQVEGLSKKEKGLMDMDNSVVIAEGGVHKGTKW